MGCETFRQTFAEISLANIQHNFHTLNTMTGASGFMCPMVKANAYGHGVRDVARVLREAGAHHLGVALIEEGIELRESGDLGSLLVFGLFFDLESAVAILAHRLTPVISERAQLAALELALDQVSLKNPFPIHFKFNTGMNRLGFAPSQAPLLREWLDKNPRFQLQGVCTHLLRGDDAGSESGDTQAQLAVFRNVLNAFHGYKFAAHALNSGAMAVCLSKKRLKANAPDFSQLGARPGIAIYGAQPSSAPDLEVDLKPVMRLKSKVAMVNLISRGDRVSYNGTWKAERDSVVGVIPVGYADGYRRLLSNRGSVLIRGRRAPVAGTICMDYFMVDMTDIRRDTGEIGLGEEVVLIGQQGKENISVEEMAEKTGTISYEILTGISLRVPRVGIRNESP